METGQRVKQLAAEMLAAGEGRAITVRKLAERLDGGSHTTIQKYLNEWWVEQGHLIKSYQTAIEVPAPIREQWVALLATLEAQAGEKARVALGEHEAAAEQRIEQAQEQVIAAKAELADSQTQLNYAQQENTQLKTRLEGLTAQLAGESARVDEARQHLTSVRNDFDAFKARSHDQLEQLRQQLRKEEGRGAAEEQRLSLALDEARQAAKAEHMQLARERQAWREQERALSAERQAIEQREAVAAAQLTEVKAQLGTVNDQLAATRDQFKAEKAHSAQLNAKVAHHESEVADVIQAVSARQVTTEATLAQLATTLEAVAARVEDALKPMPPPTRE